jgi:hypothetical protein
VALGAVEQAEFHAGGVFGEQGEVDARPVPGSPQGVRTAGVIFNRHEKREFMRLKFMSLRVSLKVDHALTDNRVLRMNFKRKIDSKKPVSP